MHHLFELLKPCELLRPHYFISLYSQQIATIISATVTWKTAGIRSIGWGWTGVIWLFNTVTYVLLDPLKFAVRYALSGRAWNLVVDQRVSTMTVLAGAIQQKFV